MSWRVVHFIKENTVEAVPASWVNDFNTCFWPPYSGLKSRTLIKNCVPPANDWDLYQSKLIGELYGDLRAARNKAAQAEQSLESEDNEEYIRKIKEHRKFISASDSDPITSIFLEENIVKEENEENEEIEEIEEDNEIVDIPILREVIKENSVLVSQNMASSETDSVPGTSKEIPNTIEPQDTSIDKSYERQILGTLSSINCKMDQILKYLNNRKMNNVMEEDSLFEKFKFPVHSMEELHNVEVYLKNEKSKKEVVMELSRFGGMNVKIMVKRIMEKIFSNTLAAQYSWLGFKRKQNFSNLIISQIIIKSVMKVHVNATASEVESAIKLWLVKAKERMQTKQNSDI